MRPFSKAPFTTLSVALSLAMLLTACSANADSNDKQNNKNNTQTAHSETVKTASAQPTQTIIADNPETQQVLDNVRNNLKNPALISIFYQSNPPLWITSTGSAQVIWHHFLLTSKASTSFKGRLCKWEMPSLWTFLPS